MSMRTRPSHAAVSHAVDIIDFPDISTPVHPLNVNSSGRQDLGTPSSNLTMLDGAHLTDCYSLTDTSDYVRNAPLCYLRRT